MNKCKLIDADKLKVFIVDKCNPINKYELLQLIDELPEDREDVEVCSNCVNLEGQHLNPNCCGNYKKPNLLKVAIKGNGTDEYGGKIIEYFEKLGNNRSFAIFGRYINYCYVNNDGIISYSDILPEGYTEISLKDEEKEFFDKKLESEVAQSLESFSKVSGKETSTKKRFEVILSEKIKQYIEICNKAEMDRLTNENFNLKKELTELKLKLKDLSK